MTLSSIVYRVPHRRPAIGANAVKILLELGLVQDIVQRSEEAGKERPSGWFQFLSGQEGHELIYDVGLSFFASLSQPFDGSL